MADAHDPRRPQEAQPQPPPAAAHPESGLRPGGPPAPPAPLEPLLIAELVPEPVGAVLVAEVFEGKIIPERRPTPPHPGFWWAALWCLGIIVFAQMLPAMVAIVILLVTSRSLTPEKLKDPDALTRSPEFAQAMLPAITLSQIVMVATAWLVIRLIVGKGWTRRLALRWPSWSHIVLALIGLPGLIVICVGIDGLAKRVLPSIGDLDETIGMFGRWPWWLGVLIIGVGPGIGEELWFRGFFGRGLVSRYGVVGGVLLTSLLFGVMHVEPRQVAYTFVMGIALHLSYLASRSLLVPMLAHMINNSLSILAVQTPELAAVDLPAGQVPWYAYAAAVLLVTAVGWAFYRSRALLVDRPESDGPAWRPHFPGVEYPPAPSATRVRHPFPDKAAWLVVGVGVLVFAASVAPTVVEVGDQAVAKRQP